MSIVFKVHECLCKFCSSEPLCGKEFDCCDRYEIMLATINSIPDNFINDKAIEFICNKASFLEDIDETLLNLYATYVAAWFTSHDEGEPVCFDEWYNNEYQEREE